MHVVCRCCSLCCDSHDDEVMRAVGCTVAADAAPVVGVNACRERLARNDAAFLCEEEMLQLDIDLLRQFSNNDYIRVNGRVIRAW